MKSNIKGVKRPRRTGHVVCVGCGCDAMHACRYPGFIEDESCYWLAAHGARGVCSAPSCRTVLARFRHGQRDLSDRALKAVARRLKLIPDKTGTSIKRIALNRSRVRG